MTEDINAAQEAATMLALHDSIADEIEKPQIDPGRLMRLMAAGVNQLLFVQARQLMGGDLPPPGTDGLED